MSLVERMLIDEETFASSMESWRSLPSWSSGVCSLPRERAACPPRSRAGNAYGRRGTRYSYLIDGLIRVGPLVAVT